MKAVRIISLIFVCICAFSFVSCSSSDPTIFDIDLNASFEQKVDFHNDDFVIYCFERDGRLEINPFEEYEDSAWQEKLKNRYEELGQKYNMNFVFELPSISLFQAYAAGMDWADLYDTWIEYHLSNIQAGLYNSLNYIPGFIEGISTGKWGSENQVKYMCFDDNYYGFYPGFHGVPFPACAGLLYCNNTLLSKYGIRPMEMVENGTWIWSEFENILETLGGVPDPDGVCGMFIDSYPRYFLSTLILSNGGSLVKEDEEGRLVSNLGSNEAIEAYEFATGLVNKGLLRQYDNSQKVPMFNNNSLAFLFEYSYVGTVDTSGFMYSDVDFSIIPCPVGPSGTYGDWKGFLSMATRYLAVPITADMDMVDAILSELYEPLSDNPYEWREYYTRQNFSDTESAEIFWKMFDNAEPDYFSATFKFPWGDLLLGNKSIMESIESTADMIQTELDDVYN